MVEIKSNKHSVGQSAYHFVWRPKYNVSVFGVYKKRDYMIRVLRVIAEKWGIEIYEMQVMIDHVHLFVEIPTTISVSQAFQFLKGGSSRLFFKRFPEWKVYFKKGHKEAHLWSPGKFFRSIGCVTAEIIQDYIRNSNKWEFDFPKRL